MVEHSVEGKLDSVMIQADFVKQTLEELEINYNDIGLSKDDLVSIILYGYRGYTNSSKFSKITKQLFPDKPKYQRILTFLYSLKGKGYCCRCKNVLDLTSFYSNSSRELKIGNLCKGCTHTKNKTAKKASAKYRASKLKRTVSWADEEKIKAIYDNCPKGYHVDHIVPLQGALVSGLHVEYNLQYLPSTENMKKGNKFLVL